jgi:asparagine synthase (glutamine-hydrolysing)
VVRRLVEAWPPSEKKVSIDFLLKRFVRAAERPVLERHISWFGAILSEEVPLLCGPLLRDLPGATGLEALECFRELLGEESDWCDAELERILCLDFLTYLGEGLLTKLDRVAMACSVENRSPYLGREVIELAARLPLSFKIRGRETKRILRVAARPIVPGELLRRRKRGLSVPLARLFRSEWKRLVQIELDEETLDREGLVDGKTVGRMVEEHQSGSADRSRAIWTVLSLVLWYRHQALGRTRERTVAMARGILGQERSAVGDAEARTNDARVLS